MPNRRLTLALILAPLAAITPRLASAQSADLIITNARIYTVDENRPVVDAMAIREGRIVATGPQRGVMTLRGPNTQVLDLHGRTVIPGMIDAHVHLLNLGNSLRNVDLVGTSSYDEVVARVAARAKDTPAGTWIIGRGWDQNDWGVTQFPTHDALSRAVPNHPVVLTRIDGHATLVNAAAMRAASVTAQTQDPSGGRIEHAADGSPTGVLVDAAMGLVNRHVPAASKEQLKTATQAAIAEMNRWGLTSVHDAGVARNVIDVYEEVAREGNFNIRDYVMVANNDSSINHYLQRGPQSGCTTGASGSRPSRFRPTARSARAARR